MPHDTKHTLHPRTLSASGEQVGMLQNFEKMKIPRWLDEVEGKWRNIASVS